MKELGSDNHFSRNYGTKILGFCEKPGFPSKNGFLSIVKSG